MLGGTHIGAWSPKRTLRCRSSSKCAWHLLKRPRASHPPHLPAFAIPPPAEETLPCKHPARALFDSPGDDPLRSRIKANDARETHKHTDGGPRMTRQALGICGRPSPPYARERGLRRLHRRHPHRVRNAPFNHHNVAEPKWLPRNVHRPARQCICTWPGWPQDAKGTRTHNNTSARIMEQQVCRCIEGARRP